MKTLLALILLITSLFYSCKTIRINNDSYAWKSYDNSELDQTFKVEDYASPNERNGQDAKKLIILCASGGGSRAAAFNIGIMLELEKILYKSKANENVTNSNILNEIDYFSTVSGGAWGASAYLSYMYQKKKYASPEYIEAITKYNENNKTNESIDFYPTFNSFEKYLANRADFRYFEHQTRYLIFGGKYGNKISDNTITDRLNAGYLGWSYRNFIENKVNEFLPVNLQIEKDNTDEITLGDVFKSKNEIPYLPMMISNTTNIDNYKLIPFTPDRLKYWGVRNYNHYMGKGSYETLPHSNLNSDYNTIPFATGIKASGGIPALIGSSRFRALKNIDSSSTSGINYFLHLQDGGIVDQQAMHSAKAILKYHTDIKEKKDRIVFIVDASSRGIENQEKFKQNIAGRFYSLKRVIAPFTAPDAQYALTRERVKLLEDEYNCTVVYLGMEVLLDKSLKSKPNSDLKISNKKKVVKDFFCNKYYKEVQNDSLGFLKFDMKERELLYTYIKDIKTRFESKGSLENGYYLENYPKSSATIMILAGRGVVQLKRDKIIERLNK